MFRSLLERYPGLTFHNLGVGEGMALCEQAAVTTVLGSCVAVTLFCPHMRCGGIFHALLPTRGARSIRREGDIYRFADEGTHRLIEEMVNLGCTTSNLECKMFGGANSFFADQYAVGTRNAENALSVLQRYGITPKAQDIGGVRGRKLFFLTHTGEVYLKRLTGSAENDAQRQET